MMGENRNMFFERWLAAYGNRLEELAGLKASEAGRNDPPPPPVLEAHNDEQQDH